MSAIEKDITQPDLKNTVVAHVEDGHDPKVALRVAKDGDDAARYLAEHAGVHVDISIEDSRRVLRKIDIWVCIPMMLVYFIQQMDKQTLSYGALWDLQKEAGLHGTMYSWLTSIVYVAQMIVQPISAYALIVCPLKWWVVGNYFCWSVCTMATGAAHDFKGLMIARALLGAFEATILPTFILVTQMWWTRREQSYRTIAVQIANSCAAIIGPLIAYAAGHIVSSKLRPWQAIFVVIGAISMAFVPLVAWMLPNSPATAPFLRHGNDRMIALERLRQNNTGTKSSVWKWDQFWETYRDPKTYLWALIYVVGSIPYSFGTFGSLIIRGLGFTSFNATLMVMPTGVIGIIFLALGIWVTNKIKLRFAVLLFLLLFPLAGASAIWKLPRSNIAGMVAAYYIAYPFAALQPLLYSWANLNASGSTKRVATTATMFVLQCAGNMIGPQTYLSQEAPVYQTGLAIGVSLWVAEFVLIAFMAWYLGYLNKKQERRREQLGLPAKIKDMSLMTMEEADAYKIELMEMLRANGGDSLQDLYADSFDDLTDFQNPMFMYVI